MGGAVTTEELEARVRELESKVPRSIEASALYTVPEVMERLRCKKSTVYNLVQSGEIAHTRVGTGTGGIRVRGSDLANFIVHRTSGGPEPRGSFKHLRMDRPPKS